MASFASKCLTPAEPPSGGARVSGPPATEGNSSRSRILGDGTGEAKAPGKRRRGSHRASEICRVRRVRQPDAEMVQRNTPENLSGRTAANPAATTESVQAMNLGEASLRGEEEITVSVDPNTTCSAHESFSHSSLSGTVRGSSAEDGGCHGEECFYSPRTATSEEPVDCEPRCRPGPARATTVVCSSGTLSTASGCPAGEEQAVEAVHVESVSSETAVRVLRSSPRPPCPVSTVTPGQVRVTPTRGIAFSMLGAASLHGPRGAPSEILDRPAVCSLDVEARRTEPYLPQLRPRGEHTCVCRIGSARLVRCLGRKQRYSPLQNLDCPVAFALVALPRRAATAGVELEKERRSRLSESVIKPTFLPADRGVCPAQAAAAAFLVLKGKFASVVINSVVTSEDDLAIEGLRCRPFFRPGQKEDLYSWARAALVRMREATGDGSSPEWASSFLDDVCLTHYFTLSDVYDDAKLTISPRPTSEHNSAGLLPSPFSLSAPELVTCSVLPQSLPLPDWLISRNRVAPRSLFTSRVLRKSSQLVQTATSAPAAPGHQRGQEPVTNSGSGGDRPQNEEAGSSRSGANSCRNAHRALRRQCGHDFFQRNADTDTRGGTEADPDSPRECREMAQSSSPSVTEDMSLSGKECGGSAVWTGFQQVKKRSTDAAEVQHKTGRGDTGKECQGIRKPYVYAELTAVQANRGTNFYAIVWEVTKALMPPPGCRGVASFLMNVAVFDESVRFDVGVHTAPGGHEEEYSLALKAKGCPADIPCVSCGDVVRVHRANVNFKFEAERNFVNLSSVVGVTAARVWPVDVVSAEANHPSADSSFAVGAVQVHTHFSEGDAMRIKALRYHAQQLLSSRRLFTTQYYKSLSLLRRSTVDDEPAYGDLIVRVVRSSMGPCCRIIDLDEPEPIFSDYGWLRGDAGVAGSHQFDSELSAYLLLVEDASVPGGHIAVVNLSEPTCEQLFAAENAIREGQWLRLRNFRWSRFRLEDSMLGRIYECIQPSRSDLARITRLPHVSLDAMVAQQELEHALQGLVEEAGLDEPAARTQCDSKSLGASECGSQRVNEQVVMTSTTRNGHADAGEREREWDMPGGVPGSSSRDRLVLSQDECLPLYEVYVPQELLDLHKSAVVHSRLSALLSVTASSSPPVYSPLLLRGMHILGLGPPSAVVSDPRTWVVVQCLLCRRSRRLTPARNHLHAGAIKTAVAGLQKNDSPEENLEVLWCPVCRHQDASMLVALYDFHLLIADAEGTTIAVRLKDAVGRRFRCTSEGGISPFFAATDAGAQRLLCKLVQAVLTSVEECDGGKDRGCEKGDRSSCEGDRATYSARDWQSQKKGDVESQLVSGAVEWNATQEKHAMSACQEVESFSSHGLRDNSGAQAGKSARAKGIACTLARDDGQEQKDDEWSSEEEGEVYTQGLVGRRYMRQLQEASRRRAQGSQTEPPDARDCHNDPGSCLSEENDDCLQVQDRKRQKSSLRSRRNLGPGRHELLVMRSAVSTVRNPPSEWVVLGCEIRRSRPSAEPLHSSS